nr:phosphatidate cytidylyltransferase [Bacteroidota bacterium]
MSNLIVRSLTGIVFVAAIIGSALVSQYAFAVLFFVVNILALHEFYSLVGKGLGLKPQKIVGYISGCILYTSVSLVALSLINMSFLALNLFVPLLIVVSELFRKNNNSITNIAYTLFGALYVSVPLSILNVFFNPELQPGISQPDILIGFFFILWTYDTFAYLSGMLLGRHKLFERISPKKTWEGAIGGMAFGLVTAWLISNFFIEFSTIEWLVIAGLIICFGTFGDLAESMFKRNINVKDSGNLLPGHGGLLDRFDAVFLAAPAVFIFIVLIKNY